MNSSICGTVVTTADSAGAVTYHVLDRGATLPDGANVVAHITNDGNVTPVEENIRVPADIRTYAWRHAQPQHPNH